MVQPPVIPHASANGCNTLARFCVASRESQAFRKLGRMKQAVIITLIAVFLLGVFVAGRAPTMYTAAAATQPARAINTLSAYERLHLPDSTPVYIFKGRVTTLGVLRTAHLALEHSRANAMARGRRVALLIRTKHFRVFGKAATFTDASGKVYALQPVRNSQTNSFRLESTLSNSDVRVGIASTHLSGMPAPLVSPAPGRTGMMTFRPSNVTPSWLLNVNFGTKAIPMPQSALQPFAKDYQDFCRGAGATACLYFPVGISTWGSSTYAYPNSNLVISILLVYDPLVIDPMVCQAEGGTMTSWACQYTYPGLSLTNYVPSSTNPYAMNCRPGLYTWSTTIDPHGAAEVKFNKDYSSVQGLTAPDTCVIQVFSGS